MYNHPVKIINSIYTLLASLIHIMIEHLEEPIYEKLISDSLNCIMMDEILMYSRANIKFSILYRICYIINSMPKKNNLVQ